MEFAEGPLAHTERGMIRHRHAKKRLNGFARFIQSGKNVFYFHKRQPKVCKAILRSVVGLCFSHDCIMFCSNSRIL